MCHENTQVDFEFGSGRILFDRIMSLLLRNSNNVYKNTQIKFRYGSIQFILNNVMHLALMYLGVMQYLTSPIF